MTRRLFVLACFTLAAWLPSGAFVYAGYRWFGRPGQVAWHLAGILACFLPAFARYFARPEALPWPAAAAGAVLLIVLLDVFVVSPLFLKGSLSFFTSFWDWQLPAVLLVLVIAAARLIASR